MRLQLSTWPEVEAYLTRSTGIIVPIGSTEQHGPNGLIGTDALCPEIVANGVAERIDVLVAPTINVGMAQHHLAFPGSITLRPSTLIAVIRDMVQSLARTGFRHIYFFNGHGGNVATVQAAFAEIYAENSLAGAPGSPLHLKLANWYQGRRVGEVSRELFAGDEGSHATPSEISLTWHAYPQAAKRVAMQPARAPTGNFRDAEDYRRVFPDGRIGSNPMLASVEAGRRLFEASVEDTIEDYTAFLAR
ncbi:creatininase family protein [Rehaibacterium terrae]|jgi:creatinine amidohydrolase|uniref:Creatinine amidohydrolase n=1 Tax=Rehaibacterium terrae TaxID=1341696 RepID=A0A7W7V6Z2_9GAMM|nr:creatininase family protein [Rehaibacterium terrae]MBB5014380.1 creatinine amidohydrolase [Rehaibacterium terrae]